MIHESLTHVGSRQHTHTAWINRYSHLFLMYPPQCVHRSIMKLTSPSPASNDYIAHVTRKHTPARTPTRLHGCITRAQSPSLQEVEEEELSEAIWWSKIIRSCLAQHNDSLANWAGFYFDCYSGTSLLESLLPALTLAQQIWVMFVPLEQLPCRHEDFYDKYEVKHFHFQFVKY